MPYYRPDNAKTGRPKIREFWVEYIAQLMNVEGLTSPIEIFRRLEAYAEKHDLSDVPSERTVNRRIADFRGDTQDLSNERFAWPESMGEKDYEVPWEAARDSLDLLRWYLERNYRRPTVRVVRWYWRVCQASGGRQAAGILRNEAQLVSGTDDETIHKRLRLATQLALGEVMQRTSPQQPSYFRSVELELAFEPERSREDKVAHETALQSLKSDGPAADLRRRYDNRPARLLATSSWLHST